MGRGPRLRKDTDDEAVFACAGGIGLLREEVWVGDGERVVRYNLAFLLPHISRTDNGRILGYDNAHGSHERHFMGKVAQFEFQSYPALARHFYREVRLLRDAYEEKQ